MCLNIWNQNRYALVFLTIACYTYDASGIDFEAQFVHHTINGIPADVLAIKWVQACAVMTLIGPKLYLIAIQIRWKFCFAFTSIVTDLHCAVVSCEVFVVIWWLGLVLQENKDSSKFELQRKMVGEMGHWLVITGLRLDWALSVAKRCWNCCASLYSFLLPEPHCLFCGSDQNGLIEQL